MSDKIKQIDPFTNIPYATLPSSSSAESESSAGSMFLSELRSLSVGQGGDNVFRADSSGFWAGSKNFDTAPFSCSMTGAVVATSLTMVGGTIRYGKTAFTDSTNAGYFISALGFYFGSASDATRIKYTVADGTLDMIGTVSGRSSATIASAISALGHFIDDRLNTSTQEILAGFTFGASGAIQIGSYSAGVTGDIRISPNGIVGRDKNNNETFAIDAVTGNATFAGELVAPSGTLGTITSATITAGTFQTASTGQRVILSGSSNNLKFYDTNGQVIGIGTETGSAMRVDLNSDITNGIRVFASADNSAGFYFASSTNITTTGFKIELTHASNDGTGIRIDHDGSSGEAIFIQNTGGAKGIYIEHSGAGQGIYMTQSGSGLGLEILKSGTGTVASFESSNANLSTYVVYITTNSTDAGASALEVNRSTSHTVLKITQSSNDSNRQYGLHLNLANAGSGVECAFRFQGSEYDGAPTSVSGLVGVIKVYPDTEGNVCYVPVYSTAS